MFLNASPKMLRHRASASSPCPGARRRRCPSAAFAATCAALLGWFPPAAAALEDWQAVNVPEELPIPSGESFRWFRAVFTIPSDWKGSRLLLAAGAIGEVDEAFFNGERIGANGSMPPLFAKPASDVRRPFVVEPDQIRFGRPNLIAWRVFHSGDDNSAPAGIHGGPVHLSRIDDALDLAGTWLMRAGDAPAWKGWLLEDPAAELSAFRERAGAEFAGHRGVVPADKEGRQRMLEEITQRFQGERPTNSRSDDKGPPTPPSEAAEKLKPAEGLAVDLVLAEPRVRQPLFIEFDDRGRMWVTQYIQYPNPAGLEVLTWDQHLRKVFDRVPPPPPFDSPERARFRGADRITIHEDTDGDGSFDRDTVFVEGLNMATSTAQGEGGVWVMQPPYLLFYPDANRDDVSDGDPIVHLSGFGLEDTHSIANSIKLGPDGWLYGATGSTVTARVKVHHDPSAKPLAFLGQNIWRYHPDTHTFELFAEGGWNTFGVDFDDKGRLFSGTNGTQQAVYFVQGGFYQKSFGKHGPHTNPYAFGHFEGLPIEGEKIRLVHQWLYVSGGAIPSLQGALVGGNSLAGKLHALRIEPEGSSFTTAETANPIVSEDRWFRPVHCAAGPDGNVYIADFYDARINHVDPQDNWDRAHGRIFRLRSADARPGRNPPPDLNALPDDDLLRHLASPRAWARGAARRLLAARRDPNTLALLRAVIRDENADPQHALEALWTLSAAGAFDDGAARQALSHSDEHIRRWTVRLLGDPKRELPQDIVETLAGMAAADEAPQVVSQLASTAQRLVPSQAAPVIRALAARDGMAEDPMIPLQTWWALESLITRDRSAALSFFDDSTLWDRPIARDVLVERTARRFMAERSPEALAVCADLLARAPSAENVSRLASGMEAALLGSSLDAVPPALDRALGEIWKRFGPIPDESIVALSLRLRSAAALAQARRIVADGAAAFQARTRFLVALAEMQDPQLPSVLLQIAFDSAAPDGLRMAAISSLRRFPEPAIAASLVDGFASLEPPLRRAAQAALASRAEWARALLAGVDDGSIPREAISFDTLLTIRNLADNEANALIARHWGELRRSSDAKAGRIAALKDLIHRRGPDGDAGRGAAVFAVTCATCHKFHGAGRDVGPDLTGYDFADVDFLVTSIVDPNLGVREEFELATVTLRGADRSAAGGSIAGFITATSADAVTIRDLAGTSSVISRRDIADIQRAPVSIMPEGLLDTLTDSQIIDLVAYLQSQRGS